jgi:hypothetical protein
MRLIGFMIISAFFSVAMAQPKVPARTGPYLGIQPGLRDVAPNTELRIKERSGNALTWIGFDMSSPGGRVFIQTAETGQYEVIPTEDNEVLIKLKHCTLNWKNDGHHLDTSWFPTAVKHVQAKAQGKSGVLIRIQLKSSGNYDLRQEGNYIFVDFVKQS